MAPVFLYNLLLWLATPLLLVYYGYQALALGKARRGWRQQLGFHDREDLDRRLHGRPRIWIQAVSVGEAMATACLLDALRAELPEAAIVVSTTTDTGQDTARKQLDQADAVVYFPFDFGFAVRKAVRALRPDVFVMVETELWPNVLYTLKKAEVATVLANGRVSDRNLKSWRYLAPFMEWLFGQVDVFAMRSEFDADRLLAKDIAPERVYVTGEIKMDQPLTKLTAEERAALRAELALADDQRLFLVGSTHPGEEEKILEAFCRIRMQHADVRLMIASRHLERVAEVAAIVETQGFRPVRRTQLSEAALSGGSAEDPVIVLDTMGELARLYGACDIAYLGGSLVQRGGHNVLEPAIQGRPVLYGPHMQNFRSLAQLLEAHGVAWEVADSQALADRVCELLDDPEELAAVERRAEQAIRENQGAAKRDAKLIAKLAEGWRP